MRGAAQSDSKRGARRCGVDHAVVRVAGRAYTGRNRGRSLRFTGLKFDWDDANILHLARHEITPEEAEEVILRGTHIIDSQIVNGEVRLVEIGLTPLARFLTLITTERAAGLRVVTGWDATKSERSAYVKSLR